MLAFECMQIFVPHTCKVYIFSGRAVTNVGRTCGPTLLLVHLYVKAIKYVKIQILDLQTEIHRDYSKVMTNSKSER